MHFEKVTKVSSTQFSAQGSVYVIPAVFSRNPVFSNYSWTPAFRRGDGSVSGHCIPWMLTEWQNFAPVGSGRYGENHQNRRD
mgnify:CR=1 FL=1